MIAAGLIICDRRPGNRIGPLAVLTGFAWFAGDFTTSSTSPSCRTSRPSSTAGSTHSSRSSSWPTRPGGCSDRSIAGLALGFIVVQGAWTIAKAYGLRPIAWWDCPTCIDTVDSLDRRPAGARPARAPRDGGPHGVEHRRAGRGRDPLGSGVRGRTAAPDPGRPGGHRPRPRLHRRLPPPDDRPDRCPDTDRRAACPDPGHPPGARSRWRCWSGSCATMLRVAGSPVSSSSSSGLPPVGVLQDSLRDALSDPSLERPSLGSPPRDHYLDATGQQAAPTDRRSRARRPDHRERRRADARDRLRPGPARRSRASSRPPSRRSASSVENERLQAEVRAQLEAVSASRARLAEAQDTERRRIERDLHDGAQQRLVSLRISLELLRRRLGTDADPATLAELDAASAEAQAAIGDLRELAQGLHPAILAEAGLGRALESLAERSTVDVDVDDRARRADLPPAVEATAYFVVAEALTNTAKHASAQRATVACLAGRRPAAPGDRR